jgi:hypothetical protein
MRKANLFLSIYKKIIKLYWVECFYQFKIINIYTLVNQCV